MDASSAASAVSAAGGWLETWEVVRVPVITAVLVLVAVAWVFERFGVTGGGAPAGQRAQAGVTGASGVSPAGGAASPEPASAPSSKTSALPARQIPLATHKLCIDDVERVLILYGSQTGTAKGFAEELGAEAVRLYPRLKESVVVTNLRDYDPDELAEEPTSTLCVFLLATYTEGAAPADAKW